MKKQRTLKFAGILVLFVLLFALLSNYFLFNKISFTESLKYPFSFSDESKALVVDREQIENKQELNSDGPNGVGAIEHSYYLELENVPQGLQSFGMKYCKGSSNKGEIKLTVFTKSGEKTYFAEESVVNNNYQTLWLLNLQNVKKVTISSVFSQYGGTELLEDEIVSIEEICLNDLDDLSRIRKNAIKSVAIAFVLSACLILLFVFLAKSKIDQRIFKEPVSVERSFLLVCLIIGMVFSVLIPVFQVPDEATHINMIYDEMNWEIDFEEIAYDFADTNRIVRQYNEKVNFSEYFDLDCRLQLPNKFSLPSITVVRHLPQALVLLVCSLLKTPAIVFVFLAEFVSVVVYAFLCFFALRLMPVKKEIMAAIMLLPICLQQMGSFSYDSLLIPLCFLLVAYILNVKFVKEFFTLKDIAFIMVILLAVLIIKMNYVFLAALIFFIPIKKYCFDFKFFKINYEFIKKYRILLICLGVFVIAFGVLLVSNLLVSNFYVRLILAALRSPRASLKIIGQTLSNEASFLAKSISGYFGWFDTPVDKLFHLFVWTNLLFFCFFSFKKKNEDSKEEYSFSVIEKIFLGLLIAALVFVTVLALFGWTLQAYGFTDYTSWSVAKLVEYIRIIPYIGGLQGRYFIPFMPLVAILLSSKKITKYLKRFNQMTYFWLYHMCSFVYTSSVILIRYWIF